MAAQRHRKKKERTRGLKLKKAWKASKKRAPRMKDGGELKGQLVFLDNKLHELPPTPKTNTTKEPKYSFASKGDEEFARKSRIASERAHIRLERAKRDRFTKTKTTGGVSFYRPRKTGEDEAEIARTYKELRSGYTKAEIREAEKRRPGFWKSVERRVRRAHDNEFKGRQMKELSSLRALQGKAQLGNITSSQSGSEPFKAKAHRTAGTYFGTITDDKDREKRFHRKLRPFTSREPKEFIAVGTHAESTARHESRHAAHAATPGKKQIEAIAKTIMTVRAAHPSKFKSQRKWLDRLDGSYGKREVIQEAIADKQIDLGPIKKGRFPVAIKHLRKQLDTTYRTLGVKPPDYQHPAIAALATKIGSPLERGYINPNTGEIPLLPELVTVADAGTAPKGYHYMPDGKLMKDSDMERK